MSYKSTEMIAAAALRDYVNATWPEYAARIDLAPVPSLVDLVDMLVTVTAETREKGGDDESFRTSRYDTIPVHLVFRQSVPEAMRDIGDGILDWADDRIALVENADDTLGIPGLSIGNFIVEKSTLNYSSDADALKKFNLWIASITIELKAEISVK